MKRHSVFSIGIGVRAAAVVASTLTVLTLALAPAVYAQIADDTVGLERPLPAFEENFPTDEAPQAAAEPDSWSEERIAPAALDGDIDGAPIMLAQFDSLETP
jgi:hypothetical protein